MTELYLPIEQTSWERLHDRSPQVWAARPDSLDVRWLAFLVRIGHWWLGEQFLDSLSGQAQEAVAAGAEDELLREFGSAWNEGTLRSLVGRTMAREGYPDTQAGGLALYLDIHLGRIVRGVVHPRVGAAAAVWGASGAAWVPDLVFLLEGLTYSWDVPDQTGHRPQIERIMVDLARDYCGPRMAAGFRYAG
ncbi:MAG TPA: hypothetical protein VHC49_21530 [Mycobacteriales bacterium]|nr:hypothetical protein [Mycobacteriales bacterium]